MHDEKDDDLPPLGLLTGRFAKVLETELFRRLQASGHPDLRPRHSSVLIALDPAGMRLTTLARRAGVSPQTMGELVDDLEQRGYLRRVPDSTDRRARLILATGRGNRALAECLEIANEIEAQYSTITGRDEYDLARRVLRDLLDHID